MCGDRFLVQNPSATSIDSAGLPAEDPKFQCVTVLCIRHCCHAIISNYITQNEGQRYYVAVIVQPVSNRHCVVDKIVVSE